MPLVALCFIYFQSKQVTTMKVKVEQKCFSAAEVCTNHFFSGHVNSDFLILSNKVALCATLEFLAYALVF